MQDKHIYYQHRYGHGFNKPVYIGRESQINDMLWCLRSKPSPSSICLSSSTNKEQFPISFPRAAWASTDSKGESSHRANSRRVRSKKAKEKKGKAGGITRERYMKLWIRYTNGENVTPEGRTKTAKSAV